MHSDAALYDELTRVVNLINAQEDKLLKGLQTRLPVNVTATKDMLLGQQYPDGTYIMIPLITAKANALAAMANIKVSQKKGK